MKTWLRYAKHRNRFDWKVCAAITFEVVLAIGALAYVGFVFVRAIVHGDWSDVLVLILAVIAWIAIIAGSRWSSRVLRDR